MWTLEKLQQRFSLSPQQLYRRLHEARELLNGHIQRGDKNAILLTESGFQILEHIIECEKRGKTLAIAVEEVKKSLATPSQDRAQSEIIDKHPDKQEKLYETRYRSLIEEIGFLKGQLALKDELLKELKEEVKELREENVRLKSKVALVEYREIKRWWQFWK